MPDDSKKHPQKGKNDPKEQRKSRRSGHQHKEVHAEKKFEKKSEEQKAPASKVIVPQKPPVYETPGPEFYQSLKRETDEILKITEEENAKYKKKEIQSNWSKYEMPIESYDDIEEQENMGADYEKLIQAPLSIGGHFQFKHEKSWDITTGPTMYDKYFEINMDNLSLALSTIPFYERNDIDQSLFSEMDILTMNNRSKRFKQKYYNDKSYSTPETEAQDKILNIIMAGMDKKEKLSKPEEASQEGTDNDDEPIKEIDFENTVTDNVDEKETIIEAKRFVAVSQDTKLLFKNIPTETAPSPVKINMEIINTNNVRIETNKSINNNLYDLDDIILEKETMPNIEVKKIEPIALSKADPKVVASPVAVDEQKKDPVIESPEDLEKWLDDFLDG